MRPKPLYTINVPSRDNGGRSYRTARTRFLRDVASITGGYTYHPARDTGAWRDPATGRLYVERMGAVDFIGHRRAVMGAWRKAFPDQIAAMITGPIPAAIVNSARKE